ncbi:glucan biosynthesis protein [Methylobacterium sp. Leaf93]|uniref:glucan biosynthesis protein n=1 Tax=Methylobacterium sp. Leaf93 TaxID=1736249 RepID=UPI0006FDCCA3|nr:glucan biosynthesis protein [Methylobacterium sp. Leaf93]KQP16985.1 glucan biosynthesis protein D [Methylobacterium sp. Leaf93]
MTFEGVVAQARRLAASPYRPAPDDLPAPLAGLSYDGYRAITFRPDAAPRLGGSFSLQLFHRGFLQKKRVALFLQPPDGPPQPILYQSGLFDLGSDLAGQDFPRDLGFAGFRLHHAFDDRKPAHQEEFLVFLGASYFRLRGKTQEYGLSARGAAIQTGGPGAEEFPDFTAFWICEPKAEARAVTILALLDSPSLAGAYRFVVEPGETSRMVVTASLHPRAAIPRLGLAPLTSMFLHGENGPRARGAAPFDDFRPQVHDSDGLVVATKDDRLWRPLSNGRRDPQISAFRVDPLDGFGLLQRERSFAAYLDVQARHEARPGLWVTPQAGFGAGAVQLFEIPSREEYMDNIVAAFVPAAPVTAGSALDLAYTLATIGAEPDTAVLSALARVVSTHVGSAERLRPTTPPSPERRLYVIDFEGPGLPTGPDGDIAAEVSASAGTMVDPVVERVPQTGGWRLYVEWRPPMPLPPGDVILRARLMRGGRPISETWDNAA